MSWSDEHLDEFASHLEHKIDAGVSEDVHRCAMWMLSISPEHPITYIQHLEFTPVTSQA